MAKKKTKTEDPKTSLDFDLDALLSETTESSEEGDILDDIITPESKTEVETTSKKSKAAEKVEEKENDELVKAFTDFSEKFCKQMDAVVANISLITTYMKHRKPIVTEPKQVEKVEKEKIEKEEVEEFETKRIIIKQIPSMDQLKELVTKVAALEGGRAKLAELMKGLKIKKLSDLPEENYLEVAQGLANIIKEGK